MNAVLAEFHRLHASVAGIVLPAQPQPQPSAPAPGQPGGGSNFDFNVFTPSPEAVPKSGFFLQIGNGALWLAFALSFAAFACGVLMWVFGPVVGSTYASQAGKTQMWKGLGGVVITAAAIPLCIFIVALVNRR